jgi:hypothetical protein
MFIDPPKTNWVVDVKISTSFAGRKSHITPKSKDRWWWWWGGRERESEREKGLGEGAYIFPS